MGQAVALEDDHAGESQDISRRSAFSFCESASVDMAEVASMREQAEKPNEAEKRALRRMH